MVSSVHRTTTSPDFTRYRCSEPLSPYGPVFRRIQKTVNDGAAKTSQSDGTPAQQATWFDFTRTARRAMQSWQRMQPGEYPIKSPCFAGVSNAPGSTTPIWIAIKEANNAIHIRSLDVPPQPPHMTITPGRTPLEPAVVTLDDRMLDVLSSPQEMEMAKLLAATLDHSV